jgi:protein involved in polysaccharide export with SLBB domain
VRDWREYCSSVFSVPGSRATTHRRESETFPGPPHPAPQPPKAPPPPTENRTFLIIDGVPQYRIGAGDLLEVFVTKGPTQERLQVPVRANGRISVSFADVQVDGLTADQAAAEITRSLSVYFRSPQVEVQVKEYNSKKVSVLGAVALAPRGGIGTIPLTGRTTLLEVIAKAGGVAPNAGLDRVRVTCGRESYTVTCRVQDDLSQISSGCRRRRLRPMVAGRNAGLLPRR